MNPDQEREPKELRPLARSLTELTVASVVSLVSGAAGFATLLVLEDSSEVLVGCVLALVVMMLIWFPAAEWSARSRRRTKAGARTPRPAPPAAPRENPSATVRRMLSGRVRLFPLMVLLLVLPSMMYGPGEGKVGILAGATVGTIIAGGLEGLRRTVRLARWQRRHSQTLLLERPSLRSSWRQKPRQVYVEPSTE